MGNKTSEESKPLLPATEYKMYCECDNIYKKITLSDEFLRFPLRGGKLTIRYDTINDLRVFKMWPLLCKAEDILYIRNNRGHHYWFGGKKAQDLEKAIRVKMPEK